MKNVKGSEEKKAFPFLSFPQGGCQKVLLVAPSHQEITELYCDLIVGKTVVATEKSVFKDSIVRLYEFSFKGLTAGTTYKYKFRNGAEELNIGPNLTGEDLHFEYQEEITSRDEVILVSCNGVRDFHKKDEKPFGMWKRLYEEFYANPKRVRPRLFVNAGDQYYQDVVANKYMNRLNDKNFESLKEEVKRKSLENALAHMDNPYYQKVMAQTPSICMMDDHDITDGAGGDKNHFIGEEFKAEYKNYRSIQLELFELLQASRNPFPIIKKDKKAFSFVLEIGEASLVVLDLRSEKNGKQKVLMDQDSENALFSSIEKLETKNVMLVIPVVPVRNSSMLEGMLVGIAKGCAQIVSGMKAHTGFRGKLKRTIDYVANLEDDLLDTLTSETNIDFFVRLLKLLKKGAENGCRYTVLSGDIHTGGSIELRVTIDETTFKLPIIVSSPIGYEPMFSIVENLLKEKKEIAVEKDGVSIRGVNNLFTSERNFVSIRPSKLSGKDVNSACQIFMENIKGSRLMQVDSWFENGEPLEMLSVNDGDTLKYEDEKLDL